MKLSIHYLVGLLLLNSGFLAYAADSQIGSVSLKYKERFFLPQAARSPGEIRLNDWARVGGATEVASTKQALFSKLPAVATHALASRDATSKEQSLTQVLQVQADVEVKSVDKQNIDDQDKVDLLTRALKEEEADLNKLKTGSTKGEMQVGTASWYGHPFHGRKTASGERYNMYEMTAAHKNLPLNSMVKVTNLVNHQSVIVKINDRGPYVGKRILDLSYAAAKRLGMVGRGTTKVLIKRLR